MLPSVWNRNKPGQLQGSLTLVIGLVVFRFVRANVLSHEIVDRRRAWFVGVIFFIVHDYFLHHLLKFWEGLHAIFHSFVGIQVHLKFAGRALTKRCRVGKFKPKVCFAVVIP